MQLPSASFGRSPLVITTFQAILINSVANIIAQIIEAHEVTRIDIDTKTHASVPSNFTLDPIRVLYFAIWTFISVPPNFRWQQFLERRFPAYYPEEKIVKTEADEEGIVSAA